MRDGAWRFEEGLGRGRSTSGRIVGKANVSKFDILRQLETAVRYDIPVVVVVTNNNGLLQDKRGDDRAYNTVPGANSADPWECNDVDMSKEAEALGA